MRIFLKTKKLFAIFLIVAFLIPSFAGAQVPAMPVVDVGPQNIAAWAGTAASTAASAAELVILNVSVGVPGVGGVALGAAKSTVTVACEGVGKAEEIAATADTFGNFSLISGSPAEATKITAKIAALIVVKTCREAELFALDKVPTPNLITGQDLTRRQNLLDQEIHALSIRIEDLRARQSQSIKEVLKAVALKIVLNLSKNMTTSLVNKMIAKYRIGNFLQYADAVSSQIYTSDYIMKNFPEQEDQLIVRSMLQNGLVEGQVLSLVRARADDALGYIPGQLDISDPNFYAKAMKAGSAEVNPFFLQIAFKEKSALAKAQGTQSAKQEISQGQGFIPVRDCSGSVEQQAFVDSENLRLSSENSQARKVLEKLKQTDQLYPGSVSQEDLSAAAETVKNTKAAMKALPQTNRPIVQLCENIVNPAGFMADSVTGYLNKHLNEAGNIKTDNIPFWATFLSDVASNFVTNIFEGGKPDAKLLMADGITAASLATGDIVNLISNSADNSVLKESSVSVTFDAEQIGPNQVKISWDASKLGKDAQASYVTIQGNGSSPTKTLALFGSITVNLTTSGKEDYLLRVYKKFDFSKPVDLSLDPVIIRASATVNFVAPNPYLNNTGPGNLILGESIAGPFLNLRGP